MLSFVIDVVIKGGNAQISKGSKMSSALNPKQVKLKSNIQQVKDGLKPQEKVREERDGTPSKTSIAEIKSKQSYDLH